MQWCLFPYAHRVCTHQCNLIPEHSLVPERNLIPISGHSPLLPAPSPCKPVSTFCLYRVACWEMSYKCNPVTRGPLCLDSLTQHLCPGSSTRQPVATLRAFSLSGNVPWYRAATFCLSTCLTISWWTFSCFQYLLHLACDPGSSLVTLWLSLLTLWWAWVWG